MLNKVDVVGYQLNITILALKYDICAMASLRKCQLPGVNWDNKVNPTMVAK